MSEAKRKFLGLFRSKSAAEKRGKEERDVIPTTRFPNALLIVLIG
jgi:hypothetical protein